jgi:hypothetical protein
VRRFSAALGFQGGGTAVLLAARMGVAGLLAATAASAAELHVAVTGNDANPGTAALPLRTIQRAADLAGPGDTVTVHAGTYRERVNPPRGGDSDALRILYRAAPGERVVIKGSEVVTGWEHVKDDVWTVILPNAFFGDFNPFADEIRGDWFDPRGRAHHTGAVCLNGDWLTEAASLEEVLLPRDATLSWLSGGDDNYLLNVAWLRPGAGETASARVPAAGFAAQQGIQTAACSEGGECIGWIQHGDWVRYEGVDFGTGAEQIEIRAASATAGGLIELRLDAPDGELLGACPIPSTGDWQVWASFTAPIRRVDGVHALCTVFKRSEPDPAQVRGLNPPLWVGRVDETTTTLWAQFEGVDPNTQLVEINVRQTVFYPDAPGRNFITVRGFVLCQAATPWAPPTAEQIGLLGTHWSKGWIIENNIISHSVCAGVSLGKHGDEFDNTSADTAEGYVQTIQRAHAHSIAWTRENIGHHIVRHNRIFACEQAGIVGSLGAAFSTIENNDIHDIHVRRLFSGAEMAGIKIHAAIDAVIRHNHIHRTVRGLWLDWMAQGTRVSRNLFHDNLSEDLFVEVNHGPFLVDNNLFLSPTSLLDMSEGGAYAHNLFGGRIINRPEPGRRTPYHPAHSTVVTGLAITSGGDNRFYNNLFVGAGQAPTAEERENLQELRWISSHGLWGYDGRTFPLQTGGNVYSFGALPYAGEADPLVRTEYDPALRLEQGEDGVFIRFSPGASPRQGDTRLVTTERLGLATVPQLPYVNPDDSPVRVDTDYFGEPRDAAAPTPGPFEDPSIGETVRKVW